MDQAPLTENTEDAERLEREAFEARSRERQRRGKTVNIFRVENYVKFDPPFLEMTDFQDFKRAIDGARYVPKFRANLAPIDKVGDILFRLREAGFAAKYHGDAQDVLLAKTAQKKFDLDNTRDRITRIDEQLYARTGERLFPFQKTGAQWLTMRMTALLADEQGLGKTLTTIVALPANVGIVVCGPAIAKGVWKGEIARWRPQLKTTILRGRDSFRWPAVNEAVIINYDILPNPHTSKCDGFLPPPPCPGCKDKVIWNHQTGNLNTLPDGHLPGCKGFKCIPGTDKPERMACTGCHPFLKAAPKNVVVVGDEAQALKGGDTKRTQWFRCLSRGVLDVEGRVWLLSGTPLENEAKELWSVLQAADLAREAFGDYAAFKTVFKAKPTRWGYEWGLPSDDIREKLRRVSLRRMREEVLPQLPRKRRAVIEVDVDQSALSKYKGFLKQFGGVDQLDEILSKETVKFAEMSLVRAALAKAKIPAMLDFVSDYEEKGIPLLVFSAHKAPIEELRKRQGWAIISGDEDDRKKSIVVEKFQNGHAETNEFAPNDCKKCVKWDGKNPKTTGPCPRHKLHGVGITIRAGGTAITLHRAYEELFVDLDYSPKKNEQCEDRAARIGQYNPVNIKILQANHILDRRITEILLRKLKLIEASVDASAVNDDAPTDKDFEEHIKRVREEIAGGKATRRLISTSDEKKALDDLHRDRVSYPTKEDTRLALELAEEAVTVGLSEEQWGLLVRVSQRGKVPEPNLPPVKKQKALNGTAVNDTNKETPMASKKRESRPSGRDRDRSSMKGDRNSKKEARKSPALTQRAKAVMTSIRSMEVEERDDLFFVFNSPQLSPKAEDTLAKVGEMTEDEREDFFCVLSGEFCPDCAEPTAAGEQHECEDSEEDEEFDDEDDEDGEEGDEEDEDEGEEADDEDEDNEEPDDE